MKVLIVFLALVLAYWLLFFLAKGFDEARGLSKYQDSIKDKATAWIITIVFGPWWCIEETFFGRHKDEDERASYPKPEDLWEPPKDPRNDWIM